MLKSKLRLACEQALLLGDIVRNRASGTRVTRGDNARPASLGTRNVELLHRLNNLQLHLNVRNKIESQF